MTIVLGIDPALGTTGWGIIRSIANNISYIASGTIKTNNKNSLAIRIHQIHQEITEIINIYKPQHCGIEETFVNKNPLSSLKLGHARGALILSTQVAQIPIGEYPANLVKKSIVGNGHATKDQMIMMVNQLLPKANITYEDEADALAIAICHASYINSPYRNF